jgi:hypothetical protein
LNPVLPKDTHRRSIQNLSGNSFLRYADVKFEYLSYCLKVKELDDEEASYATLGEPLYRVETGNYEYRLVQDNKIFFF